MLFAENMGEYLSIDEVSLSHRVNCTLVTNKNRKGRHGSLIASIKGTLSKDIITVLEKIALTKREKVEEVTLDMAKNMESAAKKVFPNSSLVTDRFYVVKLSIEALRQIPIKLRWNELDKENNSIEQAKKQKIKYEPIELENGDTPKQLLARCRYILAKKTTDWTTNQTQRASILFREYPCLKKAYEHTMKFRNIYELPSRNNAHSKVSQWTVKTYQQEMKEFYTNAHTVKTTSTKYSISSITGIPIQMLHRCLTIFDFWSLKPWFYCQNFRNS